MDRLANEVSGRTMIFSGEVPSTGDLLHVPATTRAAGPRGRSRGQDFLNSSSSDSEQRLVDVALQATATNAVELQMPTEPTLAPPGWYLVFVATAAGVPSEGQWVHLS
jgi:hypothetical protein